MIEKTSETVGATTADEKFLELMRKRLDSSVLNEAEERCMAKEDISFLNGEQWDEQVKQQRGKGRLCLTINKLPTFLDQIEGDMRQGTPGLKIKAVDNDSDPDTANVVEGLVRYTQRISDGDKIHAYAGIHAAAGGRGAWRILTEYQNDNSFTQSIKLKRIINAYSVYFDPGAEQDDKQDGSFFFLVTDMSKEAYRDQYKHEPIDFDVDGSDFQNWQTETTVRVAEYFYKEKVGEKTLYLLENGTITEERPEEDIIRRERKVNVYKIKWAKVDGKRILDREGVPGDMFPVILTWGKQLCVDGKLQVRGIARHPKDAQKLYNYFRSNDAESAALQPKQPYLMPDVCLGAHKGVWDKSNDENYPYLPYSVDPTNPGLKPTREAPAMASSANQAQIMMADNEMRDTIGIQKAALGQESNEKSGVAIQRRKQESDTGQYAYLDNLASAIRTEGQIIVGMIPEIYDVEMIIRILGKDMKEKVVSINDGAGIDLTTGKYDVNISTEGSFSTQREEFQEKLTHILPILPPEHITVIADILFEMQDFPRADDIAQRLKKLIPPNLLENDEQDDEQGMEGGYGQPPEQQYEQQQADMQAQMQADQQQMEADKRQMELIFQQMKIQAQEQKQIFDLEIQKVKLLQEEVKLAKAENKIYQP